MRDLQALLEDRNSFNDFHLESAGVHVINPGRAEQGTYRASNSYMIYIPDLNIVRFFVY